MWDAECGLFEAKGEINKWESRGGGADADY